MCFSKTFPSKKFFQGKTSKFTITVDVRISISRTWKNYLDVWVGEDSCDKKSCSNHTLLGIDQPLTPSTDACDQYVY